MFWYSENIDDELFDAGFMGSFKIKKVLFEGKSKYQKIQIFETEKFGKMLLLDGFVMLTEKHEYAYHEMIAHVPMFAHPNPKNILIVGGGDGGVATEIVKHQNIEHCDMVEIDELVVEKSKQYFPQFADAFSHPKFTLYVEDGIKFIENHKDHYDIIIVDSTDPVGFAEGLFAEEFYKKCFNALKQDGIIVAQAETPYLMPEFQKEFFATVKKVFPYVTMYMSFIPFYPMGAWSLLFASKKYTEKDSNRYEDMKKFSRDLNYFNEEIYKASFALPNFVKRILE